LRPRDRHPVIDRQTGKNRLDCVYSLPNRFSFEHDSAGDSGWPRDECQTPSHPNGPHVRDLVAWEASRKGIV
jgi:hypothetical protein